MGLHFCGLRECLRERKREEKEGNGGEKDRTRKMMMKSYK